MTMAMAIIRRLFQRSARMPKGMASSALPTMTAPPMMLNSRLGDADVVLQVDDHVGKGDLHADAGDHDEEQQDEQLAVLPQRVQVEQFGELGPEGRRCRFFRRCGCILQQAARDQPDHITIPPSR